MSRKRRRVVLPPKPYNEPTGREPGRPPIEEVALRTQHCINGVTYGPGKIRVPRDLASFLREQERNFQWTEDYLHSAGSAIIGGGSRLLDHRGRRVQPGDVGLPDGFFDNPNSDLALSPVARIQGA